MRIPSLLVALACLALVGCAKPPPTPAEVQADLTAKIDKAIKDPERAKRVSAAADTLLQQQQAMAADLKATLDRLGSLNADYQASGDQYQTLYNEYRGKRKASQTAFAQGIFALRGEVSAAEWKEITK